MVLIESSKDRILNKELKFDTGEDLSTMGIGSAAVATASECQNASLGGSADGCRGGCGKAEGVRRQLMSNRLSCSPAAAESRSRTTSSPRESMDNAFAFALLPYLFYRLRYLLNPLIAAHGLSYSILSLTVLFLSLPMTMASSKWLLSCGSNTNDIVLAVSTPPRLTAFSAAPHPELCTEDIESLSDNNAFFVCRNDCARVCIEKLQKVKSSYRVAVVSTEAAPPNSRFAWFQTTIELPATVAGCTINGTEVADDSSNDALRSFSKTSVLFVSISFIILMVISLAWLVFYYVQRFRYAHAKDRLQRRLFNAARKALAKMTTRTLKAGDVELDTDCAVCIDPYQMNDIVRQLPCQHVYHKSCIDPWLLEHRTCPMCKADILKMMGLMPDSNAEPSRRELERDVEPDTPDVPSSGSEANYQFNSSAHHDPFQYSPNTSPQLVLSSSNAKTFAIVPLTVHHTRDEPAPSSSRNERAASAGAASDNFHNKRGSGQGQIVNLVQVRTRSANSARAATIRSATGRLPVPIEGDTSDSTESV